MPYGPCRNGGKLLLIQQLYRDLVRSLAILPIARRAVLLVWAAAPAWTIGWTGLVVLQALLPVLTVQLVRKLVNGLVHLGPSGGSLAQLVPGVLLLGGVLLTAELLQFVGEWVRTVQAELVQDHAKELIHDRTQAIDFGFYQQPEATDLLYQAASEAGRRPLQLLESLGALLQGTLTLLGMGLILLPYGVWLPFVLLLASVPTFLTLIWFSQRSHQLWARTTPLRRQSEYFEWLLTHGDVAAETRIFGLADHFRTRFKGCRQQLRTERLVHSRAECGAKFGAALLSFAVLAGVMGWMAWRLMHGTLSLGDLALFYQTLNFSQGSLRSVFSSVAQIYSNSLFLRNLFQFLDLKPSIGDPPAPVPVPERRPLALSLRNVQFGYPQASGPVLKGLSLEIPAGKITAVVGPNGAGKSTLVALLCRFFDPDQGQITLGGVDLRDLRLTELRQQISVLFQFPVQYQFTAGQNIGLGDLSRAGDEAAIAEAARAAGIDEKIDQLPAGYATQLGRFLAEGSELSGGEWQRVALARAFLRQSPVIILDEPTSFMDPWSEAEWFARLQRLAAGRTVLLITHRFSIAMRADLIHVMEGGQVVESGRHAELIRSDGLYGQSWQQQMHAVRDQSDLVSGSQNGSLFPSFCAAAVPGSRAS